MYRVFSAILFLMMTASLLYAAQGERLSFCMVICAMVYGVRYTHKRHRAEEAEQVLEKVFCEQGVKGHKPYPQGRFIEAEIYRNDRRLDVILFDRKTGRIRSTY